MLEQIAAGVLTAVITGTGRRMVTSVKSSRGGKAARRDAEIASWFDTYELAGSAAFPEMPMIPENAVAAWLARKDVHAILHELLAVRITDAPGVDGHRLRMALRDTAWDGFADVEITHVERDLRAAPPGSRLASRRPERWLTDEVADRIFVWADREICELVARFEARDEKRWRAAREDAFSARIVNVLNAIERHMSALDGDRGRDAAWVERYRRQAARTYGSIQPPDFAKRRKVPIADLYVAPDITVPDAPLERLGEPRTVAFDDLVTAIDRTVLLGDPGGGKSTAAQVITHRWAGDPDAHVPFQVVLRDFADPSAPERSVAEYIAHRLNVHHQDPPPDGAVERLLLTGAAAVIFDGLDELVDTGRRLEITRTIENFCTHYPLTPVLVTSRKVGYDEARLDDTQFTTYTISGFDEARTRDYVQRWFAQEDDVPAEAAEQLADAFMTESEPITDLRSNPLMLSYLCVLYRGAGTLPRDRPAVYEQCTRLLLDTWDARRSIKVSLQARNHIEPALRYIAYWLFIRDEGPQVTERELIDHTAEYLHENAFERRPDADAAAREFIEFCRGRAWILSDVGTTADGEALYTFTHRTFLEYFAAYQLAADCDTPERLARKLTPRIARAEWEMVAQLAVQIKSRAPQAKPVERIYVTLLGEQRRRAVDERANVLRFLARCLAFVDPPPGVIRDLVGTVVTHFADGDPDEARRFEPLTELMGSGFAWRDMVAEKIDAAADRMVAAGGKTRLRALLWIVMFEAAADDASLRDAGRRAAAYGDRYWADFGRHLLDRHARAIRSMAKADDRIWIAALVTPSETPFLTLQNGLAGRDRVPRPMLEAAPADAFHMGWGPHGTFLLANLGMNDETDLERTIRSCGDLGRWVAEKKPPFFTAETAPESIATEINSHAPSGEPVLPWSPPDLTPDAYAGAAVLLMAHCEGIDNVGFEPGGSMADLAPYLRRKDPDHLPDLPVAPHFQELFKRWARGEVWFVDLVVEPET